MARAYVGLGSNIEPGRNVRAAVRALGHSVRIVGVSTHYRTAPIGRAGAPPFVNGVLAIETDLPRAELQNRVLRPLEQELGRSRDADRNAPRTIDLDLLFMQGDKTAHPDLYDRAFVAWPLVELAPRLEVGGVSVQTIAQRLPRSGMVPLPKLTAALREEIQEGRWSKSDVR